jgi:2-haloacid dehalogenase
MLDFSRFEFLTFDCYGTLIDWEAGILSVLRPLLTRHGTALDDESLLECYGELEAAEEVGEFKPYRKVLEGVMRGLGGRLNFAPSEEEVRRLPESVAEWPPFPDTVAALQRLATRFRLAVISNVDDDLFAGSARLLRAPFAHVITAQQVRSYKPSHNNFQTALARLGVPKERVLHVAQSLYHDIAPANVLGWTSVWVNRRGSKSGGGATKVATARPDLEVLSLKELADLAVPGHAPETGHLRG